MSQARPVAAVQAGIALHRTRKSGRYEPADLERFALIHRHLKQALTIGCRIGTAGAMQQCAAELVDRNAAAILLLDERKRLVFANRGAEALPSAGDGVRLHAGGIALPRKEDNDRLQGLIEQALSGNFASGCAIRALRPSGKRPYGIVVGHCPGITQPSPVSDPRCVSSSPIPTLKRVYQRTASSPRSVLQPLKPG